MLKDIYRAREYYFGANDGGGGGGGDGTGDGDGSGAGIPFVLARIDVVEDAVKGAFVRVAFNKNVGQADNALTGKFLVYSGVETIGTLIPTTTTVYDTNVSGSDDYDSRQYADLFPSNSGVLDPNGEYTVFIDPEVRNRASNPVNLRTIDQWDYNNWDSEEVIGEPPLTSPQDYIDQYGAGYTAGYVPLLRAGYFPTGYRNPGSALSVAATYEFAGVALSRLHAIK